VPATSLLTCGLIFVYSIFAEGFSARGRTQSVTLLDEVNQRAITIGYAAFYSPLTPSGGLHYSRETEIISMLDDPSHSGRGRQGAGPKTIDWTADQHLDEGWVTARVPAYFMLRANRPRRERLQITPADDGTLDVVNGLGADIKELLVAGRQGQLYRAGNIPAGAGVELQPVGGAKIPGRPDVLRQIYSGDRWFETFNRASTAGWTSFIRRGTYIAVLSGRAPETPFMEHGLEKAHFEAQEAIVFGLSTTAF